MSDSEEDLIDKQIKIVFLGDASVGKVYTYQYIFLIQVLINFDGIFAFLQTCIVKRFCYDEFSRQYSPTQGADFYMKRKKVGGQSETTLKISDVGGQELNGNMIDKYLFDADVCYIILI